MEVPLTPLELARRTRALYPHHEAVVDGELRLTYAQFFDRSDRWAAALRALGVGKGDRVAYIAPNTHAQLESFYAVPQTGALVEATYGKGRWVYVGLNLWRQLPSGTTGAYQLLANLLSLPKTTAQGVKPAVTGR